MVLFPIRLSRGLYAAGEVLPELRASTNRTAKPEVGRSARIEDGESCSHRGCDYMGTHLSDRYGRVCESHFYAEAAGTLSP